MPFKRDLFTGKLVETEPTPNGRAIIARGSVPKYAVQGRKTRGGAYSKTWRAPNLGVANPDQIPEYNEAMRAQGMKCWIDPITNECCADSQSGRNDALRFFNKIDYDGGYGDVTTHDRPVDITDV